MKNDAKRRKKLSVHVISMAEGGAGVEIEKEGEKEAATTDKVSPDTKPSSVINDMTVFKSSHEMYPLVQPYINITRKGNKCKL